METKRSNLGWFGAKPKEGWLNFPRKNYVLNLAYQNDSMGAHNLDFDRKSALMALKKDTEGWGEIVVKGLNHEEVVGIVEDVAWDFDQYVFKVNGDWYCQSELIRIKE